MSSGTWIGKTDMPFTLKNSFINEPIISHAELLKEKAYIVRGVMSQKRGVRIPKEYIRKEKPLTGS